jgi:hypothetical protein
MREIRARASPKKPTFPQSQSDRDFSTEKTKNCEKEKNLPRGEKNSKKKRLAFKKNKEKSGL